MPGISIFKDPPLGSRINVTTQSSIGTLGTPASGTIKATHKVAGREVWSTFTLTDVPLPVVNGTEYQSQKLFTFPEGRILVFDSVIELYQKTTSDVATTLNASSTGAIALGSAAASNVALTSTMADILPSTALTSSATINVAGSVISAQLDTNGDYSELVNLDGTSTAIDLYLNNAYATTTDVDADATQVFNGTVIVQWLHAYYSSR